LERQKKLTEVFESALERAPDEREGFLAEVCEGDDALRNQVETLLESYRHTGDTDSTPKLLIDTEATEVSVNPFIGRRIGSYKLVREIGHGGMGAVYLAMRADEEFQKRVAIKLIKRGMDTDFIIRRFRNERQILAGLDHPNIARLLDGGTTEDGLPYFVMEYVEGQPIHYYSDTHRLSTTERLRLFLKACGAVEYAHHNLIVHRDLKPSNILVTSEGTPKLLDFGIAKLLNPDIAPQTLDPTTMNLRLMTPEYASPEQARGEAVTSASDVYSLGVLLYELLTGRRPYKIQGRAPEEVARVICDIEPEKPSVAIFRSERVKLSDERFIDITPESVSATRDGSPENLRRQLTGDLDNIVLKALRKEPQRRYRSVAQLARDIERRLQGLPISAPVYFSEPLKIDSGLNEPLADARSIAVLPFKILHVEQKDDAYLGIGMADAIITKISNIRRLIVRPTSSVLKYAEGHHDALAIGQALDVNYILDGRVQRVGDRVRVTVQLVNAKESSVPLWAAKFDENFTDMLSVEDVISTQVAQALMPKLTGEEEEILNRRDTENALAYQAYLKGRYYWNTYTEDGLAQAIIYFMQAVEEDPEYAQAHAGVADYYNWLGVWGAFPPKESFAAAKSAALKALALDETLGEAHSSLAFASWSLDRDWTGAEERFKRAIELNPSYPTSHRWYSYLTGAMGRHAEAISEIQQTQKLDPLSPTVGALTAFAFYNARLYDRSLEELRKAVELDHDNYLTQHTFSLAYAQKGMYEQAISSARKSVALSRRSPSSLWALGTALASSGQHEEARGVLNELKELSNRRYVSAAYIARIHAELGERDEAFAALEKACDEQDWWVLWMGVDPRFDALRSDPRYRRLIERIGLATAEGTRLSETESGSAAITVETQQPPPNTWRSWQGALAVAGMALFVLAAVLFFARAKNHVQPDTVGGVTRLTHHAANDVQPKWSPNADLIAFSTARDGKPEIYTMDSSGESLKRLTTNAADDFAPAWSPDGRKIAFTSKRDGNDEIYLMNADGSSQLNVSHNAAADSRPKWSPDGSKLVFTSNRGDQPDNFDIYVMTADGSNPMRLTNDPAFDSDPVWSPDGQRIAFASNRAGSFQIFVMNADGTEQNNITHNAAFNGKPAWSPDGRRIALTSNRAEASNYDVYVMDTDGNNARRLTFNAAVDDEPAWSSDGKQIIFESERDGNREIYVVEESVGEIQPKP
jgi:serine/threonine protein kinase/tetratricopeptide (TPR) repeat protein